MTGKTTDYVSGTLANGTVELSDGLVITYDATAKTWKVGGMAIESVQGIDLTAGAFLSVINATDAFGGCQNPNGTWNTAAVASIVMAESGVTITFDPTAENVIDWKSDEVGAAGLTGTIGADQIIVNNYVRGGIVSGGGGGDKITIDTTSTSDNYAVLAGSKIDGGDGDDTITIKGHVQGTVDGGADNDTITVEGYVWGRVEGGAGNDEITINAPAGRDGYTLINANIDGGTGNDIITVNGHMVGSTITGGTGKDVFIYNANDGTGRTLTMDASGNVAGTAATVSGFEGIGGGTGNDTIDASAYASGAILIGGKGADKLTGGTGADIFVWRAGDFDGKTDTITNFGTGDKLYLGGLTSTNATCLKTGDGMFTVQYTDGTGNHSITIKFGGNDAPANETAFWAAVTDNANSTGFTTPAEWAIDTTTLIDPVAIVVTAETISRTGSVGTETITGGAGADTITITGDGAGAGYAILGTTIDGGYGNDTISIKGYALNSTINGGANDDVITVDSSATSDKWALLGGNTIDGGAGNDTITIIGNMLGSNIIMGGAGNDVFIHGGTAAHNLTLNSDGSVTGVTNATITGFEGIGGGAGNDTLIGNAYDNILIGGKGNDTLTGGGGADTFKWSIADLGGTDTVMDFSKTDGDTIKIEGTADELKGLSVAYVANTSNTSITITHGEVTQTISFNGDSAAAAEALVQIEAQIPKT